MPANIETDPLFVQLTDALRAGPGSSQWQEAVAALRQQGVEGSDEHRLLIQTRENLEAGRDYRAVRAGPGFTRKLMSEIENQKSQGGKHKGIPTATIVALLCGVLILSAVGYVVWRTSTVAPGSQSVIDELDKSAQGFVDKVAGGSFAAAVPDGFHTIGALKLAETDGLHVDSAAQQDSKGLGGGVVINKPLPGNQRFAVDIALHAPTPTAAVLLEAFVSTDSNFSPDKGTSSRDLVWQLRDRNELVLVNGSEKNAGDAAPVYHAGDSVRLIVGKDVAIIEAVPAGGGKPVRLWAGPHELGADPRYIGVRFLQTGATGKSDLSVQEIKVTTGAEDK